MMNTINLSEDSRFAYHDTGGGKPVMLFLHGLGCHAGFWIPLMEAFSKDFRCIAPDLPGHGLSSFPPDARWSPDFYAGEMEAFIGRLKLSDLTVVGHSMGGLLALSLAQRLPAGIRTMVLSAPAGFESFGPLQRTIIMGAMGWLSKTAGSDARLRAWLAGLVHKKSEALRQLLDERVGEAETHGAYLDMLLSSMEGMFRSDMASRLNTIRQPVLFVHGANDPFIPNRLLTKATPEEFAREAAGRLPDATLELFPACGHFPHLEYPERFAGVMRRFVGIHGRE